MKDSPVNHSGMGQPARGTGVRILTGDSLTVLRTLPAQSVQMCVTSPPYFGLRDYGVAGQIGLEPTPEEFVSRLVALFREVRRVLKDDGTCWINLGDSYAGGGNNRGGNPSERSCKQATNRGGYGQIATPVPSGLKPKDLIGIPWRVAFALQADGWYLRSDIIWHKPNPMPESVKDRPTKTHEYLFLLAKSERYLYDADAIREPHADKNVVDGIYQGKGGINRKGYKPVTQGFNGGGIVMNSRQYNPLGRNKRTVWTVTPKPFKGAHFATFPPALIEPCILAGSRPGDVVLDPFNGAGTTGMVSRQHGRKYLGIELNPAYVKLTLDRLDSSSACSSGMKPRSTGLSKKAA